MVGTMHVKRRLRLWVATAFTLSAFGMGAALLFLNSARTQRFLPALIFFVCPALYLALFGGSDAEQSDGIAAKSKFAGQ